jgi:hypothetical protein
VLSVDCPFRPPAVALDGATVGDLHVAAASVIGAGHLHEGQPRQDSYTMMSGRSGRLYVAVADGLGSRPTSQLGASLFTESVLVAATEAESDGTDPPTAADLLTRACARMRTLLTGAYDTDPRDAACVGAVAVISNGRCQVARVGDVAAFTLADDTFTEVFAVDSGFVNVVTATLPDADPHHVETVDLGPVPVIMLGTDGVAGDLRHSAALRTWLAERWRAPLQPFAMGDTLRYRRQGSHDDRTAVVIWGPATSAPDGAASGTDAAQDADPVVA